MAEDDNPFAVVILTVLLALKKNKLNDEILFKLKYLLAKSLLLRKISRKKIDDLLIFLQLYVRFADSEYSVKFEKVIEELTENKRTMGIREMVLEKAAKEGTEKGLKQGIEQGIERGREESKMEFVKNLLATGKFSITEIANLANASETMVYEIKNSLA